jgi:adenylate kinase
MIHFVCGLSRSGKTTLIESVIRQNPSIIHVRARSILASLGRPTNGLDIESMLRNQEILRVAIRTKIDTSPDRTMIIDGHAMIETSAGPVLVPDSFFAGIRLRSVTFINRRIEEIASNRGIVRASLVAELESLAEIEAAAADRIARIGGAVFARINSNDFATLLTIVGVTANPPPQDTQ